MDYVYKCSFFIVKSDKYCLEDIEMTVKVKRKKMSVQNFMKIMKNQDMANYDPNEDADLGVVNH